MQVWFDLPVTSARVDPFWSWAANLATFVVSWTKNRIMHGNGSFRAFRQCKANLQLLIVDYLSKQGKINFWKNLCSPPTVQKSAYVRALSDLRDPFAGCRTGPLVCNCVSHIRRFSSWISILGTVRSKSLILLNSFLSSFKLGSDFQKMLSVHFSKGD